MSKCKKAAKTVAKSVNSTVPSVEVTVNVTNIVKYISIAGIAIVGIIFGTKCYADTTCMKLQNETHTKER